VTHRQFGDVLSKYLHDCVSCQPTSSLMIQYLNVCAIMFLVICFPHQFLFPHTFLSRQNCFNITLRDSMNHLDNILLPTSIFHPRYLLRSFVCLYPPSSFHYLYSPSSSPPATEYLAVVSGGTPLAVPTVLNIHEQLSTALDQQTNHNCCAQPPGERRDGEGAWPW
jgi:hypothetical protein